MPPEQDNSRWSRRQLLRAGGATALTSSTAGCVATLPPLGRRVRFGRVDPPAGGSPDYRRWLPEPTALADHDESEAGEFHGAWYATPGDLGADVVGEGYRFHSDILRAMVDYAGVDWTDYDWVVSYGSVFVGHADLDREAVTETLSETGYERAGTHRGYALYEREDVPRALAVGGEAVVFVDGDGLLEEVRAVLDAEAGSVPRYHETNADFDRLSTAAGTLPFVGFGTGRKRTGYLAHANGYTFDADGVYFVWRRLYPEGETPSKLAVQDELTDDKQATRAKGVDVSVDGRLVTVERRHGHRQWREDYESSPPPPLVTWGVDHDEDDQTVTARHEAGDRIPADRLTVEYGDVVRDGDVPTIEAQFADEYDTVGPGDAVTVDVSDVPDHPELDADLLVTWSAREDSWTVLLRYELK